MKRIILSLTLIFGVAVFGFGQTTQNTKNTVDQTLRSSGRVNPSTLGMEFDLPLGSYPGRGINLPLGLSYSSKVWRFEVEGNSPGAANPKTWVEGIYSERAAAGWTSTLAVPWIELTGSDNRFDQYGRPATPQFIAYSYIRRITVHLPGASHELRAEDGRLVLPTPGGLPPASAWEGWFHSSDGSGIKYFQNSNKQIFRLFYI